MPEEDDTVEMDLSGLDEPPWLVNRPDVAAPDNQ